MGRAFEFRKERKMKRWGQMARAFTRIGKDIVVAVKAAGPDPDSNARLRAILQNARAANMPKDNITRAIKSAVSKDQSDYKEILFEGYGAHGVAVLVETATDNNNRTVADLRSYFSKYNGSLGTSGCVAFMFDHSCHFRINKEGQDVEALALEFIDFGAEEVFDEQEGIMIYGAFESFGKLQKALEIRQIEILSSGFERIPNLTQKLTKSQKEEVDKLLEKLEEHDDVQHLYHNMIGIDKDKVE